MPRSFTHALVLAVLLASCSGERRLPVRGAITVGDAQLQYVRDGSGPPVLIVGSATYYPKAFSSNLREHFELVFVDGRHFVARCGGNCFQGVRRLPNYVTNNRVVTGYWPGPGGLTAGP